MSDILKLKNQLCFPLYALSRQVTNFYRPLLEELGLTYPQYLVMLVLWENKKATVKSIGEQLWLDSGTLTPLLKRMEANGLIMRERDSSDERIVNITITDKGNGLQAVAENIPSSIRCKLDLTDEEIVSLRNYLKKILMATAENK